MASRRSLKKTVNYITELAAGLCLVESANANAEKREAYSEVFLQIINLRNDIISRISHTEPGSVKLFYKKLRADFNRQRVQETGRTVEITAHETSYLPVYLPQTAGLESRSECTRF